MVVPGAQVTARQTETNLLVEAVDRRRRAVSVPVPETRSVPPDLFTPGFRRRETLAGADRRLRLRTADRDEGRRRRHQPGRRRRGSGHRSRPEPDRRDDPAGGSAGAAAERTQLPRLALLVPGVSPTNTSSTQLFAETSAVPGQGLSVGSQRNLSNNFIVDGLSANDDAAGLSGIPYTRGRGGAVPGRHFGRAGGTGPGARRLRERRHQERHQLDARRSLRLFPRRQLQRAATR